MHGGGISTYCYFTAAMLINAGFDVTVFTQNEKVADFRIEETSKNLRVIYFNSNPGNLNKFLGYAAGLSYAFAGIVKRIIEKEDKPDYIEAQDYLGIAYYLTQYKHLGYSFLKNIPIIITLHSPAFIYLEYNKVPTYRFPDYWTCEMEKQAIIAADALISPTKFLVTEIEKHISLQQKDINIIANPYQITTALNPGFEPKKIIYYGKLSPQKGSFKLLEYFSTLWNKGFKYSLHIIGGMDIVYHPEMKTMGQLVKEKYSKFLQDGRLQLHGKIKPSQIENFIKDAHVIIVPSIVDNMPYVVMEAMSIGKIVLVSKQGGQQEMIEEGISGFLFDHDEPSTFENKLLLILGLTTEEIVTIGNNARERIKNLYSFITVAKSKVKFLKALSLKKISSNNFPFLHQQHINTFKTRETIAGLLTIVIPYYNMGDYIEDCLNSIINSTYKNVEIILINDGSSQETSIEKLNELKLCNNIKIINQDNKGLAETRNIGAKIAKGEYLAFIDADDKVEPTYYAKTINALAFNDNVFFAGSWVKYFGNSTATWPTFTPQPPYCLVHNPINSSALVYKNNAFLSGGLNDKKVDFGLEDYESVVSMMHNGYNGVVIPEILFYYRVRKGSMIRNITNEKLLYSNKYISEKHSAYYINFAIPIINLLNSNGPGHLFDNPTFEIKLNSKIKKDNIFTSNLKGIIKRNEMLKNFALIIKKIIPTL